MIGRWLSRLWWWLTEGPKPKRNPYPKGDPPSDNPIIAEFERLQAERAKRTADRGGMPWSDED